MPNCRDNVRAVRNETEQRLSPRNHLLRIGACMPPRQPKVARIELFFSIIGKRLRDGKQVYSLFWRILPGRDFTTCTLTRRLIA
jgi:hypothetical protein